MESVYLLKITAYETQRLVNAAPNRPLLLTRQWLNW